MLTHSLIDSLYTTVMLNYAPLAKLQNLSTDSPSKEKGMNCMQYHLKKYWRGKAV